MSEEPPKLGGKEKRMMKNKLQACWVVVGFLYAFGCSVDSEAPDRDLHSLSKQDAEQHTCPVGNIPVVFGVRQLCYSGTSENNVVNATVVGALIRGPRGRYAYQPLSVPIQGSCSNHGINVERCAIQLCQNPSNNCEVGSSEPQPQLPAEPAGEGPPDSPVLIYDLEPLQQ